MTPDRIIVPLDVSSLDQGIKLIDQLPEVSFWKVGLELFVGSGAEILGLLKAREKKIFLDLKFHDIPNTVAGACRSASQYGVDLLTLHSSAGREALVAATAALKDLPYPPRLLAITLLTSINPRELAFDLKIPLELSDYALQMALLAQESGIDGAVCSPQEVSQLRAVLGPNFLLVCPGVRPAWAESGDQRRVMTPLKAFEAGADYLVMGRPITAAPNPREAWERVCGELADG
jgi:orotidine-5'-phosphate decarboxylase